MLNTNLITTPARLMKAKSGPTKNYPNEINKIKRSLYSHNIIGKKSSSESLGRYGSAKGSLEQEILWAVNIIKFYEKEINDFISKREHFENLIINKNYKSAMEHLDSIEKEHGFSLWLIEAKIALLQLKDGLDTQKNFISDLYNKRKSADGFDIVFYLSFLISQRNEPLLRADSFTSNIKKQLSTSLDDEDFFSKLWLIVKYFVFGENIHLHKEMQYLLSWIEALSIYDLYDFVVLTLINLLHDEKQDEKYIKIAVKCLKNIKDIRIKNIVEFNKTSSHSICYEKEISYSLSNKLHIELLCHSEENIKTKKENTLLSDFLYKTRDVFQANETRKESFEWLRKNFINFKHISIIRSLYETSSIIKGGENGQRDAFITSFSSPSRESLYTLRELEKNGGTVKFKDDYLNLLYKEICILFDEKIYSEGILSKNPELITDTRLLLKDIIFTNLTIKNHAHSSSPSEAFKLAVDSYLKNKNYIDILPLEDLVRDRKWLFYQKLENHYDAAIIIALYIQVYNNDDKQRFNMKACCQTFVNEQKVSFHHLLEATNFKNDEKRAAEFLSSVCTPETLEIDTPRYSSARSVLNERIKVCEKSLNMSYSKKIEEELQEIKRKIAISDGLKTADTRGITVDLKGFSIIATEKIKDNYLRYLAFLDAGIDQEVVYNAKGSNSLIYNPNEESDQIVIGMISELIYIFLSHHEYGLDYYLSMRIRHGRLIGILRGPLEQRKLITKYSSEIGGYADNMHWKDIYDGVLSNNEMEKLQKELSFFSTSFDSLIKRFVNDFIQIKNEKKPLGLYTIPVTTSLLDITKKIIKDSVDFDVFLKNMFDTFLIYIEGCSKEVQKKIKTELKYNIRDIILTLQQNISALITPRQYIRAGNNMPDELNHLRTDIENSINNIISWFETSTYEKQDIRFYSFPQLVDIGLARTKQTRLHFTPNLNLEFNESSNFLFEPSILPTFSDLFSILFDNISDHNGVGNDIDVNINAEVISASYKKIVLSINVRNKSIVTDQKEFTIERIKDDIKNHNIRSRQEGHSGYHKIKAMSIIKNEEDLNFGFDGDYFYTKIVVTLELHYLYAESEDF